MDPLKQDLRYAARSLAHSPGFAAVAVLTLALGIGANSAIFSVVDSVLLRPLPYPEPDRIVRLWEVDERGGQMHVTAPNFLDWRQGSRSFDAMAVHSSLDFGQPATVLGGDEPIRAWGTAVSAEFFRVLGVPPAIGRTFTDEERAPGGSRALVVSHRFWGDQLGGTREAMGAMLEVWGESHQVVGVMPAGFHYPGETDLWIPVRSFEGQGRQAHNWVAVGRLAAGTPLETARGEIETITGRLRAEHGTEMDAVSARVTPLHDELVGEAREPLLLLLGAAGFVLLIACTNLASALLARGTARGREMAVRASLGASRARLVRQLFTESLLLSLAGAAAGLFLAHALVQALGVVAPALPRAEEIGLDTRALGFTLGLAFLTALLFGLLPALRTTGSGAAEALRAGGRGGSGVHRRGPWALLVGGEVALALLLLIGSGLLIKSFWQVSRIEPGFDVENVLTVDVALPGSRYAEDEDIVDYFARAREALRELPGIEDAGIVNHFPLSGVAWNGEFTIQGRGVAEGYPDYRVATPGYFEAVGIPLLRGRRFEESDRAGTPYVVLINQAMAERYWAGQDPVGQRIGNLANDVWIYGEDWLTIVGVVGNVRHRGLTEEVRPALYVNALQRPRRAGTVTVAIRTSVPAESVVGAVRDRLRSVDSAVPLSFATVAERLADSVADRRFLLFVLGLFAAVALLLAAVGIYGVVAYSVERRTREMGIRLALGARPAGVLGRVLGDSMRVVAGGIAIGVLGAMALSRLLHGLLYDVSPIDPLVFGGVVLVLAAVALLASYAPARRAARVDPMTALRAE